jgi:hypothetical protein
VWTDFYDWNTFQTKIFEAKLDANKKYQLFESCYENADTVQCRLSSLADSATYDNNLLKPMTVQAQQKKFFEQALQETPGPKRHQSGGIERELC